jgi:hypothetical protein
MVITKEFLKGHKACTESYKWVIENNLIGLDNEEFINKLMEADRFNDANWLITKLFDKKQAVRYAVNAAELVIDIFEKEYPKDNRPRLAIAAAKKYLSEPNRFDAQAAYDAFYSAVQAAYDAFYPAAQAAYSAVYSAAQAAYSAAQAAQATYSAAQAAQAVYSAINAAAYANGSIKNQIIEFGLKLLKNL